LPDIIHEISFDVQNNEKVGIFGRTGSVKSTLSLGFLRIIELS
jgi:ABC-type multidrug transport system fused ATPase/permease subunit